MDISAGRSYFRLLLDRKENPYNLSCSLGIVIICVVSLLVRMDCLSALHLVLSSHRFRFAATGFWIGKSAVESQSWHVYRTTPCPRYERIAWIPLLVVFIIALGVGGKHLINAPPADPATPEAILTFASTIAGFIVTYSTLSSDFTIYFRPDVSRSCAILPSRHSRIHVLVL